MDQAHKEAYSTVVCFIQDSGYSLAHFPSLKQIDYPINKIIDEALFDEYRDVGLKQYKSLNNSQKDIVDRVLLLVEDKVDVKNNCIYVDGPGGSGKTFVYTTIAYILKGKKKIVYCMAYTGIAALLLPDGKTVHKTFGLPVHLYTDSTSNIKIQSKEANNLKNVDLFIWDEAPMSPKYAVEVVNKLLQDIMNNSKPFGGKIFVLGGDFRQLLPIREGGTRTEIIIGDGSLNDSDDNIEIPAHCFANENDNIVSSMYGSIILEKKYDDLADCVILSARNLDVDELNNQIVNILNKNTEKVYTSIDTLETFESKNQNREVILTEYLNTLSPSCLPLHLLRLRQYTIVILIRNLNIQEGLCNE
ncbi:uncharacterized protein LOC141527592 [Cotesia typhae]|uniref:uncharacterized protein LOC141527592 n=1 Tax=Cotesia typhae TaxID=2053667 RepID=UPI003D696147